MVTCLHVHMHVRMHRHYMNTHFPALGVAVQRLSQQVYVGENNFHVFFCEKCGNVHVWLDPVQFLEWPEQNQS